MGGEGPASAGVGEPLTPLYTLDIVEEVVVKGVGIKGVAIDG